MSSSEARDAALLFGLDNEVAEPWLRMPGSAVQARTPPSLDIFEHLLHVTEQRHGIVVDPHHAAVVG